MPLCHQKASGLCCSLSCLERWRIGYEQHASSLSPTTLQHLIASRTLSPQSQEFCWIHHPDINSSPVSNLASQPSNTGVPLDTLSRLQDLVYLRSVTSIKHHSIKQHNTINSTPASQHLNILLFHSQCHPTYFSAPQTVHATSSSLYLLLLVCLLHHPLQLIHYLLL